MLLADLRGCRQKWKGHPRVAFPQAWSVLLLLFSRGVGRGLGRGFGRSGRGFSSRGSRGFSSFFLLAASGQCKRGDQGGKQGGKFHFCFPLVKRLMTSTAHVDTLVVKAKRTMAGMLAQKNLL